MGGEGEEDLEARVAELEARVAELEAERAIERAADEALELALRDRLPLDATLQLLFPVLLDHTEGFAAAVRTFDEDLQLREMRSEGEPLPVRMQAVCDAVRDGHPHVEVVSGATVIGQRIDVAGQDFGAVAVAFDGVLDEGAQEEVRTLIDTWCEVLDNYLGAIAQAQRKLELIREMSNALKEPVLDRGIEAAIDVLRDQVDVKDLLLVFRHEEDVESATLHYKIIQDGQLTHDSHARDLEVDEFIRTRVPRMLHGPSRELLDHLGIDRYREELLINGVREERLVGKLIVTKGTGAFDTFDRDLLERFADYLRQRIVDFNREWKHLSLCFPPATVHRLLSEEGYVDKYLRPREAEVAVLYCDISGFTRLSEQVLREPPLIGRLIDGWSQRVVDIVWESGGVFDKMVGDCVIALWGPPFFDVPPRTLCRRAAEAARAIRDYTRQLSTGAELPQLSGIDPPIGVATALSFVPMYVGLFGPNEDFTGFSSGMNATARLQGVAERDEILCMEGFVETHGDDGAFLDARSAEVKNVAEPLRYRPLR